MQLDLIGGYTHSIPHIAHYTHLPVLQVLSCDLYVAIVHLLILYLVPSFVVSLSQSLSPASPTLLKATTCWPGNSKPFIEACAEINISKLADNLPLLLGPQPYQLPAYTAYILA